MTLQKEEVYLTQRDPVASTAVTLGGIRTLLGVPLLNKGEMIGAFFLSRQEVQPFTDKQIALVQNFADQAVIAIKNARLLNELRQSLEQQIATGEILSSMSGSIADTKPVFDAIVRNLLRLFGTRFATIMLLQDGIIHLCAVAGDPGFERLTAPRTHQQARQWRCAACGRQSAAAQTPCRDARGPEWLAHLLMVLLLGAQRLRSGLNE